MIILAALFLINLFSCKQSRKIIEPVSQTVQKSEYQRVNAIIRNTGSDVAFVSLKDNYDRKSKLNIYNEDNSLWKSFNYDDNFDDENISAYAMDPETALLVFRNLGSDGGLYKVLVNEEMNLAKYVRVSDSNFETQTLAQHVLSVFAVDFDMKTNPLRRKPDENSSAIHKNPDSFYFPKEINDDWLLVEDENSSPFWIKWRDSSGQLLIELFYDA